MLFSFGLLLWLLLAFVFAITASCFYCYQAGPLERIEIVQDGRIIEALADETVFVQLIRDPDRVG